MSQLWRIYRVFFTSAFARELEFRANFFAKIVQNVIWIGFFVLILLVIYSNAKTVAGWTEEQSFVLAATCFIMNAVVAGVFMALMEIPEQVRRGTLDFVITKPVDSQFWVSFRRFNFDQIGTLIAGIGILIPLAIKLPTVTALGALGYGILLLCSCAIFYSLNLFLMTLGIWLVRVDNLWVLGETVMQVARYPLDIYSTGLQRFFTVVLPLAFIATIPSRQLVIGFDLNSVVLGLGWALFCLGLTRWFWRFAVDRYQSASS